MSVEPCTFIDIYGWPVLCGTADPCMTGYGTTLYRVAECGGGNPPIAEWCADYVGHPACSPIVEVGTPPTLPTTLPATGVAGGVLGLGVYFLLVGFLAIVGTRRRRS